MISYSLHEIQKTTTTELFGNANEIITQIYFDTRNIVNTHQAIYIALKNNQFLHEAYTKGIRNFICFEGYETPNDANYIVTKNPLFTLQTWAKKHRKKYNLPIIGITGSNGKTIVKEWLNNILSSEFYIIRSPKSYNSQLGLPLSVLEITQDYNLGIFEAGISKIGEMLALETILKPTIGVLTNIGEAHLENFTSQQELRDEKLQLFSHCKKVVCEERYKTHDIFSNAEKVTFGTEETANIKIEKIQILQHKTEINYVMGKENITISIPFTDKPSINNTHVVIATLYALEVDIQELSHCFIELEPVEMRLELKKGIQNSVIINDTFNSDIVSVIEAINVLNQQFKEKIIVLSELQIHEKHKEKTYQKLSQLINKQNISEVYLLGNEIANYHHLFNNCIKTFQSTEEIIDFFSDKRIANKAILIKGSRKFQLEKLSKKLEFQKHDTILEVNLHSLMSNVNFFKAHLKPQTKLMAMVKANAYGMGIIEVAKVLQHYHIDYLGVAYADEGALLRQKGIYTPIMVMNPEQNSFETIIENQLEPEIYSLRVFQKFIQTLKAKSYTQKYPIHIKIDSGMHRLGFSPENITELIIELKKHTNVEIKSIFSHLAVSDKKENDYNLKQIKLFLASAMEIENSLGINCIKHILNSSGITNFADYQLDMVRLGIGMYGDSSNTKILKHLQTVATLKTVISQVIALKEGETVGYGRRYVTDKETIIATLPIGYADGIHRIITRNNPYVLINQQQATLVGSICMDMMMCDVTNIDCKEGDEVIIFGENPTITTFSSWCETISYECLTSVSPRVKRIYYRE